MEQQNFNGFDKSEADLVQMAMAQPLSRKIEISIELLRIWEKKALKLKEEGFWLAYSGGKDSDCILELAKMAGVKFTAVYNVTTIDPPELVHYIKREHPEVVFNRPAQHLLTMMVEHSSCKGPPTRSARWCCEEYKEQGGNGYAKIIGVRVAESSRRAKLWRQIVPNRNGGIIVCPIVYWTDRDVWDFHKGRNLAYCELYDEGWHRLGCVGCPLAGSTTQKKEFARWPKYEKMWRRAFNRFWEKWHDVPTRKGERRYFEDFGSAEEFFTWWISGKKKVSDCQGYFLFAENDDMNNEFDFDESE